MAKGTRAAERPALRQAPGCGRPCCEGGLGGTGVLGPEGRHRWLQGDLVVERGTAAPGLGEGSAPGRATAGRVETGSDGSGLAQMATSWHTADKCPLLLGSHRMDGVFLRERGQAQHMPTSRPPAGCPVPLPSAWRTDTGPTGSQTLWTASPPPWRERVLTSNENGTSHRRAVPV